MLRFLLRRIAFGLVVVSLVTATTFALVFVAGDPAKVALGKTASAAQLEAFRARHGLDRAPAVQFTALLGLTPCLRRYADDDPDRVPAGARCGLLQGDLGRSFVFGEPVSQVLATRLPRTILLGGLALLFELVLGLFSGALAALRRDRTEDHLVLVLSSLGGALPTFVLGPVALYVFAFLLGWFPLGGYGDGALDHVRHAVLPALVLAVGGVASYARLLRTELVSALGSGYVRAARARGLPERIVVRHALRNALAPVAVVVGLSLPGLVGGAIITEAVFGWPGIGRLALESITALDAPMVLAVVWISAAAVQVGSILADVALAWLDPRVTLGDDAR